MTQTPLWSLSSGDGGVLVTLGRTDTALYAPLRDWMMSTDIAGQALQAGDDAPDFFLPDDRARLVDLRGLLDDGPVVLCFVGGSWCSFCIAKLKAVEAALARRSGRKATLVAITPETGGYPRQMRAMNQLNCTVLSDVDYGVALLFGLISVVPPSIVAQMSERGLDLPAMHGVGKAMLAAPAVYVIAPSGEIVLASLDTDYMTKVDTAPLVATLDRLPKS